MRAFGAPERIIELGAGDGRKTRLLLDAVSGDPTYIPIDIDANVLGLQSAFPNTRVSPIRADYREITSLVDSGAATAFLFLGSSIGNYDRDSAIALLRNVRRVGGVLLLGADLRKSKAILEAAYNDALGVTAAFNLNLLVRINRELGGNFDIAAFEHRAFFNQRESRIEIHLVSRREQSVTIGDRTVHFDEGESIHTENSYKYSEADLHNIAKESGFAIVEVWTDSRKWFADAVLVAR